MGLILIIFMSIQNVAGQKNELYQLGEELVKVAKSDNPDKIVDFVDPNLDLDKKAEILESFLKIKELIFTEGNNTNIKLFNVIRLPDYTLFIVQKNKDFIIIKSQTNEQFKITDHFAIFKKDLAKRLKTGKKIYKLRCYSCHNKYGEGSIGPNLTDPYWKYVNSDQDLYDIIAKGKKGTMMIAFKDYLTPEQLDDIVLYIKALQGKKTNKPKKPEGNKKALQFKL